MYNQTYLDNLQSLNRCKRIYNVFFGGYLLFCSLYIFTTLYLIILVSGESVLGLFIDGLLMKGILFFIGAVMGIYKRNDYAVILGPLIMGINIIATSFMGIFSPYNFVFFVFSFAGAVCCFITNKKYRQLEQCDGFPYFNERFEQQKAISEQYKNKEVFRDEYESLRKTSSDTMDDI